MNIKIAGRTDVGRKRSNNQDSILINEALSLVVVADGMGGHSGGEVASSIAAKSIEKFFLEDQQQYSPSERLIAAIQFANQAIYEFAKKNPKLRGMGTTVTSAFFHDGLFHIGQVGDSRCYLFQNQELFQITEDHSQVYELLKAGVITEEQVSSVQRNVITRSVGFDLSLSVDLFTRPVLSGDRYLLCSDGLSGMLSHEQITQILSNFPIEQAVNHLVDMANHEGGEDNISAVVLELT